MLVLAVFVAFAVSAGCVLGSYPLPGAELV